MRNHYYFCSICGKRLRAKRGLLFCAACGFINYRNPRPAATALIVFKNKILLARRRNKPFKGWWDFVGGFVDRGETSEEALERELKEELGTGRCRKKFFGVYAGTYPSRADPFHVLSVAYIVKPTSGGLKISDENELREIRWFSRKELPRKIAFDSNQKILKDFLKIWKKQK